MVSQLLLKGKPWMNFVSNQSQLQQYLLLNMYVTRLMSKNATSGANVLSPCTSSHCQMISSIERNDWTVVYRGWAHTGGGFVYSWHFKFSLLLCHFCFLTGGKSEMLFFLNHAVFPLQMKFRLSRGWRAFEMNSSEALLRKWNCLGYGLLSRSSTVHINDK